MQASTVQVVPKNARFAESSYCRFFFPARAVSGDMADSMGGEPLQKFDANYTDAEAWANAGYVTTGTSAVTHYMTRAAVPSQLAMP